MQWSAIFSSIVGGTGVKALQLLSGAGGVIGVVYGLHVLMVERAEIPLCSAELLEAVGQQSFLREQKLTVEVAGAVVRPGVWEVGIGSRVAEAIEKAGGFSQRADRTFAAKGLNLADPIKDGEKIYVPFENEAGTVLNAGSNTAPSADTGGISVNTASADQLGTLPGIGEARAQKIIENRPYSTLDELLTKGALTEAIFEDIKNAISL